ncbi:hypothetical protein [Tahibacter harae]|uniref:DUF11 domain-containing protein n=1 Tax=Tahibacter harae TaxID=2963937 RepID=A0ABT1QRP7_9GAMM|nr:hypothetical protein [Tahibacter harae]MCQ4164936.1 hypothetical protein [Tahibacter harae]
MNSNARNSGLRRALFACGLAATAAAAALSPDWSSLLKAQGYYGSVDLSIAAAISPTASLVPGQDVLLLVTVTNSGLDAAQRVRTVATANNLSFVAAAGCTAGTQYPQCNLADSLAAGSSADYLLQMSVPADARNHVQFSASVASDDSETRPGDEIVLLKQRIYVPLDLRTDVACAPQNRQERFVRCSIRFRNDSTYGARQPTLRTAVSPQDAPPVRWSCQSTQSGLCAAAQPGNRSYTLIPGMLAAGASVTFFADIPLQAGVPLNTLDASAALNPAMAETELNPADNGDQRSIEPTLFLDGFDQNP